MRLNWQMGVPRTTGLPTKAQCVVWVKTVLDHVQKPNCELCVRLVSLEEMTALNHLYRGKNKPTNVLSFKADTPPLPGHVLLGDMVICPEVVGQEAIAQEKPLEAHFAHMVIHGTLHLLGYNHTQEVEAAQMEALEVVLLSTLGYNNPYKCEG
jgi:probable rRNA maturation factor